MPILSKQPVAPRSRTKANRFVGMAWLAVLFLFLLAINLANSTIEPMLGTLAPLFRAALIISTIWNGVLLAAIGWGHGWARFVLALFLFSFVVGQNLFIINIMVEHPSIKGDPIHLLTIIFAADIFAGSYLLVSADIRQIAHHGID